MVGRVTWLTSTSIKEKSCHLNCTPEIPGDGGLPDQFLVEGSPLTVEIKVPGTWRELGVLKVKTPVTRGKRVRIGGQRIWTQRACCSISLLSAVHTRML